MLIRQLIALLVTAAAANAQDSVRVVATWTGSPDAVEYAWQAGSDNYGWSLLGTTAETNAEFRRGRPTPASPADSAWFCVAARDTVGNQSANACAAFVVLAMEAPQDTTPPPIPGDLEVDVIYDEPPDTTPEPPPPAGDAWAEWTFDHYSNTAEWEADCDYFGLSYVGYGGVDNNEGPCYEDQNLYNTWGSPSHGRAELATDPNPAIGTSKAIRYDYVDQACTTTQRTRPMRLPADVEELWIELWVKFTANTTSCNSACPPCDHKLIFLHNTDFDARWALHFMTWTILGELAGPSGQLQEIQFEPASSDYYDDEWHELRWHVRYSTTATSNDGVFELWIDGQEIPVKAEPDFDVLPGTTGWNTIQGKQLRWVYWSGNKDKGRDSGTESQSLSRVRVWNTDPGW